MKETLPSNEAIMPVLLAVLADGVPRLAALMAEYGVGVATRQTLTIKILGLDYFLED